MGWVDRAKRLREWAIDQWMPQPVVYFHIPKCGGTSVGRALRQRYLLSQTSIISKSSYEMADTLYSGEKDYDSRSVVRRFREELLIYHMHTGTRCIAAHVVFSNRAHEQFSNIYKFMTVLRDPVKRFISHYEYFYKRSTGLPIETFLETDGARYCGLRYVEYLSGLDYKHIFSDSALDKAVENIGLMDIVGFINQPEILSAAISEQLGFRPKIGHANKAVKPASQAEEREYGGGTMERIRDLCEKDIHIYKIARDMHGGMQHEG